MFAQMEYAVVCTYSWVHDAVVKLYETVEDAIEAMEKDFSIEVANDTEAGHDFDIYVSSDNRYCKITNYRPWSGTDVTEWRVVKIER